MIVEPQEDGSLENPFREITLEAAQVEEPELQLGDFVEEQIESVKLTALQRKLQNKLSYKKYEEAERALVVEAYKDQEGEMITGVVKKATRDAIVLDLVTTEAVIYRDDMLPRENHRPGDRVRGLLYEVKPEAHGDCLLHAQNLTC